MSLPIRAAAAHSSIGAAPAVLDDIALVRIAGAGGATRAQLVRDLGPLVGGKLSTGEWRQAAEAGVARLLAGGLVQDSRGRLGATKAGAAAAARFLGTKDVEAPWSEQRDVWLVAKALGVDAAKPGLRKALTRPDGLSALIVQQTFGLAMRQALSPSKLRAALALVALERAFGGNVKDELAKKDSPVSAQAGRVLAGQLLHKPRDYLSDPRLIAALSAEQVGAARPDADVMRLALLRRLAAGAAPPAADAATPKLVRAPSAPPREAPRPQPSQTPQRPGLAQFSAGVLVAARSRAEGWPGGRKAFISRVWEAIRSAHPEWGLSEIEFKDMLAGAHRAGQLVLTGADLKNKQNIKEFEDSAILYKNTVWHYVRVED